MRLVETLCELGLRWTGRKSNIEGLAGRMSGPSLHDAFGNGGGGRLDAEEPDPRRMQRFATLMPSSSLESKRRLLLEPLCRWEEARSSGADMATLGEATPEEEAEEVS